MKDFSDGKNAEAVKADLKKIADEPVKISTDGDPYKGPANARITMVEFSDFQCPFCTKAVAGNDHTNLRGQFPKDVKLVFKQFPSDTAHSEAEFGAEASLAAQACGMFWENA